MTEEREHSKPAGSWEEGSTGFAELGDLLRSGFSEGRDGGPAAGAGPRCVGYTPTVEGMRKWITLSVLVSALALAAPSAGSVLDGDPPPGMTRMEEKDCWLSDAKVPPGHTSREVRLDWPEQDPLITWDTLLAKAGVWDGVLPASGVTSVCDVRSWTVAEVWCTELGPVEGRYDWNPNGFYVEASYELEWENSTTLRFSWNEGMDIPTQGANRRETDFDNCNDDGPWVITADDYEYGVVWSNPMRLYVPERFQAGDWVDLTAWRWLGGSGDTRPESFRVPEGRPSEGSATTVAETTPTSTSTTVAETVPTTSTSVPEQDNDSPPVTQTTATTAVAETAPTSTSTTVAETVPTTSTSVPSDLVPHDDPPPVASSSTTVAVVAPEVTPTTSSTSTSTSVAVMSDSGPESDPVPPAVDEVSSVSETVPVVSTVAVAGDDTERAVVPQPPPARPVWLPYVLSAVAVVVCVWLLVRYSGGRRRR